MAVGTYLSPSVLSGLAQPNKLDWAWSRLIRCCSPRIPVVQQKKPISIQGDRLVRWLNPSGNGRRARGNAFYVSLLLDQVPRPSDVACPSVSEDLVTDPNGKYADGCRLPSPIPEAKTETRWNAIKSFASDRTMACLRLFLCNIPLVSVNKLLFDLHCLQTAKVMCLAHETKHDDAPVY